MEFWGAEVKSGEPLKVSPGGGMVLHLSQANIGELKKVKGNESVCLFLNVDGKKLVLGTLFTDKLPQQQFDLVFEKDFELSHNSKSGSVYFYGYKASADPHEEDHSSDGEFDDSESEDVPLNLANNGKHESKANEQKSDEAENSKVAKEKKSNAGKQNLVIPEIKNDSDEDSMSGDDDEDDSEDEDESDDESDESSEETPKKAETSKKRPVDPATKTPVSEKKAKSTPQKTDGKKGGKKGNVHVDTPYPSKPAGKTPADKANKQTPKSGALSCKSCNRAFLSQMALESHSKAKHGGGK